VDHEVRHQNKRSLVTLGKEAVGRIRALAKRGLAGRAFWLSGASGTGKSSIARLIAVEVAGEWDIEELDAAALTVAQLRDIERGLAFRGMSATGGHAVIINETQGLKRDVIRQLLVSLERIPSHVVWCSRQRMTMKSRYLRIAWTQARSCRDASDSICPGEIWPGRLRNVPRRLPRLRDRT
jgi:hypothetical protein